MTDAPSPVPEQALRDLHIQLRPPPARPAGGQETT